MKKGGKIVALLLTIIFMAHCFWNGELVATTSAATSLGPDDEFDVQYDTEKYTKWYISRQMIRCYSQYGSMWSDLDEDDKLGVATIRFYYLEPKEKNGANYYGIAGAQVSMNPVDVAGNVTGMSQMAQFGIKTINSASRVCSPTVDVLNIQKNSTTSKNSSVTVVGGINYTNGKWGGSGSVTGAHSWGSSTSFSYNFTNLNLTQKDNNNGFASWCYDYISKDGDKSWNAYLMSSSKVAGQVVYRLNDKPSSTSRVTNAPSKITYDIRFGAGNKVTGAVANRLGPSTNRDMCVKTGTVTISW